MPLHPQAVEAYRGLKVAPDDVARGPQITPYLREVAKRSGKRSNTAAWIPYLDSSGDPEALAVADEYHSVLIEHSKKLPIEAFCLAAKVSPWKILEVITSQLVRHNAQMSGLLASMAHPALVEKTIKFAMKEENFADRQTIHKAVGFLPQPKGSQTNITLTQNANPNVAVLHAPSPESTIRKLADRFNAEKRVLPTLPPPIEEADEAEESDE